MSTNPHTPPRWAEYLLELLIPLYRLGALQGDLYELFHKRLAEDGPRRARLLFARDVLYVLHELSYDRYHRKADRTYRIVAKGRMEGSPMHFPVMGPSLARDLRHDYPEIREATRLWPIKDAFFSAGPHPFREPRFARVDSNFFSVFTLPFVQGDPRRALAEPNTVVITEAAARKYFPGRNPLGFASLAGEPETKGTSCPLIFSFSRYCSR